MARFRTAFVPTLFGLAFALGLASGARAQTASFTSHGVHCQPTKAAGAGKFDFAEGGIYNVSTASYQATCTVDLGLTGPVVIDSIWVDYRDRNASSAAGNFNCYVFWVNNRSQTEWGTFRRYSCSVSGGCASDVEPTYSAATANSLYFASPFGTGTKSGVFAVGAVCDVPAIYANAASHVIGLEVFVSNP
ncbi:MAG TPA: hypothetical protein PK413_06610 [Thermoanaerobaculia bacterium]|nr:hypothetical protein [Thermoanaerobaculia bacterium]